MPTPARRLAHRLLVALEQGQAILSDLLATAEVASLPSRDRALLHELVLGSLRTRGRLDHALRPLLRQPLEALDIVTRAALRLGAHQILNLRVPDHAAVGETVGLVDRSAGLVNAVLRRLVREGAPPLPDPEHDCLGWLTTGGSLPDWLASRWIERLGPGGAMARARALAERPPTSFRLNPRRPDAWERILAAGLEPRPLRVPGAWEATAGRAADLAEDVLALQDEGSQLVAHLAAGKGWILDACAAPGGKAALMADLVKEEGRVVAAEASVPRLGTLAARLARWGSPNVVCLAADALRAPFARGFDTVLLDAPCSGLGTLGRHPDIRWRVQPSDLARHAARQRALLRSLARLVRPGGRLVYATCSLEPEEGEDVIEAALAEGGQLRPVPPPGWASVFGGTRFLRTLPERDRADGFFVAVLERA